MKSQKNNMWMKILSVVIAVLIWLFVANTNDPVVTKRFYSIPVKVMNEDALTKRGYAYEILDGEEVNIRAVLSVPWEFLIFRQLRTFQNCQK